MKRKEEAKYLDKEWKKMQACLKSFLETGNQDDLHKLRVQIKKLKAMLVLFEDTSAKHHLLKHFKEVKKIFRRAGEIRDAHINLQLSERYQLKNELFEQVQQKIIDEGTIEFKHKGKKFIREIKNAHKHLKKQLPKIHNNSIAGYYQQKLQEVAVNLTVSGFNEDMHDNRKLIKILVYNQKIADKALNGLLPFNTEYLDKLQEAIGKWHDNILAEQLFSSPELNDKPMVTKIKRINAGVKRSIAALADDFLKKATTIDHAVSLS